MSDWYERDASFWQRPNVRSTKKLYLRKGDTDYPICGTQAVLILESPYMDNGKFDCLKCKRCLKKAEALQ